MYIFLLVIQMHQTIRTYMNYIECVLTFVERVFMSVAHADHRGKETSDVVQDATLYEAGTFT